MLNILPIYQARDLLSAWTNRTIRGRYQQSILGWLWAVVQPIASVAIFSVIFTQFVPVNTGDIPYPVFSYIAIAPWAFFSTSLQDMTSSLVQNIGLVTKVYFPREVLPVSAMLARLLDFGVAALVLVLLIVIYRVPIFWPGLAFIPLIIAIQVMLVIGLGLLLSASNVFFRDVQPLLTLIIQLWFYASPIIYPITLVPEKYLFFYRLNPMAGILESYRAVLVYQRIPDASLLYSGIISGLVLIFGYWFFKRFEFSFVDII